MTYPRLATLGLLICVCVYLFVSAPPDLPDSAAVQGEARVVEVEKMFNAVNTINEAARMIYTKRIVGPGKDAGLAFGEDWAEPGVEKGPLPALFLRLAAQKMEAKPPPLGLYLGSDAPINASNLFTGDQAASFDALKSTGGPVFSSVPQVGMVAMYPDVAGAQACVSCHNAHKDSPKTDWKLNDIMGATTWTYPHERVPPSDYLAVTEAFFTSVEEAYGTYLDHVKGFAKPVVIGADWPDKGRQTLPDVPVFMAAVRAQAAEPVFNELILISDDKREMVQALKQ